MTQVAPVLVTECPAGHWWARLDPRWLGRGRAPKRAWCPEHQAEAHQAKMAKIQAKKTARNKRYDALPRPRTRRCSNPDPKSHSPGAVLPIREFYRKPGKRRADGTQAIYIDPRCKVCRREEAEARRQRIGAEANRERQARYRANRARVRERREKERLVKYSAAPLRRWLQDQVDRRGIPMARIAAVAGGVDDSLLSRIYRGKARRVTLETLDRVFTAWDPGAMALNYPDDEQEAA